MSTRQFPRRAGRSRSGFVTVYLVAMDQFVAELRKVPLITRVLVGSTLAVTIPEVLELLSRATIYFGPRLIYSRYQLWRAYTTFFYAGRGLGMVFSIIML